MVEGHTAFIIDWIFFFELRASAQTTRKRNEGEGSNNLFSIIHAPGWQTPGEFNIASGVCSGEHWRKSYTPRRAILIGELLSLFLFCCGSLRKVVLSIPYVVEMQWNHCIEEFLSKSALITDNL